MSKKIHNQCKGILFNGRIILSLCFLFTFNSKINAQSYFDVAGTSVTFLEPLFNRDNPSVNYNSIEAFVHLPLLNGEKRKLLLNPSFENIQMNFVDSVNGIRKSNTLLTSLSYAQEIERFKFILGGISRLNGSFQKSSDLRNDLGGVAIISRSFSEQFNAGLGYLFISDFYKNISYPVFSIDWTIKNNLYAYLVLPRFILLEYKINRSIYSGVRISFSSFSYKYQKNDFTYLSESRIRLFCDVRMHKDIWLTMDAGIIGFREGFDEVLFSEKLFTPKDYSDALMFKTAVVYRKRLKN